MMTQLTPHERQTSEFLHWLRDQIERTDPHPDAFASLSLAAIQRWGELPADFRDRGRAAFDHLRRAMHQRVEAVSLEAICRGMTALEDAVDMPYGRVLHALALVRKHKLRSSDLERMLETSDATPRALAPDGLGYSSGGLPLPERADFEVDDTGVFAPDGSPVDDDDDDISFDVTQPRFDPSRFQSVPRVSRADLPETRPTRAPAPANESTRPWGWIATSVAMAAAFVIVSLASVWSHERDLARYNRLAEEIRSSDFRPAPARIVTIPEGGSYRAVVTGPGESERWQVTFEKVTTRPDPSIPTFEWTDIQRGVGMVLSSDQATVRLDWGTR